MPGHHAPSRTRKASATRKANNQKKVAGVFEGGLDHLTNPEPPHTGVPEPNVEEVGEVQGAVNSMAADPLGGDANTVTTTITTAGHYPTIDLMNAPAEVSNTPADVQPTDTTEVRRLTKVERRVAALNLRTAGHSFRVIAEELGVSVKTAYHDVADALSYLSKYERVLAEDHRAMQLSRLDAMLSYVWQRIEQGDTFAIQTGLSIMARQSKLLGLDAPIEIDVNIKRPLKEATLADLMELANKLANGKRAIPGAVLPTSPQIVLEGTVADVTGRWEDKDEDEDEDGAEVEE